MNLILYFIAFGVYAVRINVEGLEDKFYGIVNFGKRPTINSNKL